MISKVMWPLFSGRLGLAVVMAMMVLGFGGTLAQPTAVAQTTPTRRVNAPYFATSVRSEEAAIFWFGDVTPSSNHANVRVAYKPTELEITLHIFDRQLWYDTSPSATDMTAWDTAVLYLQPEGNSGSTPTTNAYQFVGQLNHSEDRGNYQAAYRWNGASWQLDAAAFTTLSSWRGDAPNTAIDDKGWVLTFRIPFAQMGSATPATGAIWGMALTLHDRDNASSSPAISAQTWPETLDTERPSTWGQLHFGSATFTPPPIAATQTTTIRQGLNGSVVPDGHVGGGMICGEAYNPNFFDGWGSATYAGSEAMNIQNQWDVADWPCFSKYYVEFPLSQIPPGQQIASATLTLHQFGGASPGDAVPSLIQALTVDEAWQESTLNWNNAPLAVENIAATWVGVVAFAGWPGIAHDWDVSAAAAAAYAAGKPLRLVFYSADGDYHSGKYFSTSDAPDWNATARPTLTLTWGSAGFVMNADKTAQTMAPGGTAVFNVDIAHGDGLDTAVTLAASSPVTGIQTSFAPSATIAAPGGQATLTVADQRSSPPTAPQIIPVTITASSGDIVQETTVYLLLNVLQTFLPITARP